MSQENILNTENAITVSALSKAYKLYANAKDRLKEAFHPFKKKYHHEFLALNGVNLNIRRGQTTAIIGRNGSGKSTLLQCICGIVEPTNGSVEVNGRIAALLELGAGFNPEFTGRDNLYMNAALLGFSREQTEAKVDDILAFADIGEFIDQPVRAYSSGMFVRLAFAVAIHVEPDILIVDEALAVGDIHFQSKCFEKLHQFRQQGVTVVFVTHDLNMVTRYCDYAYLLDSGQIYSEGEPKKVVAEFRKLEVAPKLAKQQQAEDDRPDETRYGNNKAKILSAGIYDNNNEQVLSLDSGAEYAIRLKVKMLETLSNPVFAFTIKDAKGSELMGTNTHFQRYESGDYQAGDIVEVEFTQPINLVAGHYLLSVGCVGFENGELTVYERRHGYLSFQVISEHETFGIVAFEPKIKISSANL